MNTFFLKAALLLMMLPAAAAAAQAPSAGTPSDPWGPGEIHAGQWQAASEEITAARVRVARVTKREELPGGPWANGEIGDYVLRSPLISIIVRAENRRAAVETPGAGCIVDIADNRTNWDLFGGLFHAVRVNGRPLPVRYEQIRISPPLDDKSPPFLSCTGVTEGDWSLPVVTIIRIEPGLPHVMLMTRVFNNTGGETLEIEIIDRPNWGTLPVFVSGHGYPIYTRALSVRAPWLCGLLDDVSIGFVNNNAPALEILTLLGNRSSMRYAPPIAVEPGQYTDASRAIVVSHGDMTSLAAYNLLVSNLPRGALRGVVKEEKTQRVVPDAQVWVRTLHKDPDTARTIIRPFAIARTDRFGQYQIPLPEGEYEVQTTTVGREPAPYARASKRIKEGDMVDNDIEIAAAASFLFEVTEAGSGRPLPARVDFAGKGRQSSPDLGPDWQARGCRASTYLAAAPTSVMLVPGDYTCTFSRGPEYNTVTRTVTLGGDQGQDHVKVELEHVAPTPDMVSVDLHVSTNASPWSRSRPIDVVLAAAGEGLDWIVSGDLHQATDLQEAIQALGLDDYIRASAGLHLSVQQPRVFGEFYIFPVPPGVTPDDIQSLAGPDSTPDAFLQAVRRAFPGALVAVADAAFSNASYLHYYGFDLQTARAASSLFSADFDAIFTHQTNSQAAHDFPWKSLLALTWENQPKIPLAASWSSSLYYQPLGYPRLYLQAPEDSRPLEAWNDQELVRTLRDRSYFITNGPLIDREINSSKPGGIIKVLQGQFGEKLRVLGAPWVKVTSILGKLGNRSRRILRMAPTEDLVKFPRSEEGREPYIWQVKTTEPETGVTRYQDNFVHVEVQGEPYNQVVRAPRSRGARAFAVTPPQLIDADGDGAIDLSWRRPRAADAPNPEDAQ